MTDRLLEIFRRQGELEERYGPIETGNGFPYPKLPLNLDDPHDQMAYRDNNGFVVEELFEATGLLKNKPWKQTLKPVDREAFIAEMADAVHFILKSWIFIFGNPDDAAEALYNAYMGKSEINKQRQEHGY